jgi:hypothetical protein
LASVSEQITCSDCNAFTCNIFYIHIYTSIFHNYLNGISINRDRNASANGINSLHEILLNTRASIVWTRVPLRSWVGNIRRRNGIASQFVGVRINLTLEFVGVVKVSDLEKLPGANDVDNLPIANQVPIRGIECAGDKAWWGGAEERNVDALVKNVIRQVFSIYWRAGSSNLER